MKDLIFLILDLLTALAKLLSPGGSCAVIAENLLLKQELIIHSWPRQRAPNLTTQDRTLLGFDKAVPALPGRSTWRSDWTTDGKRINSG